MDTTGTVSISLPKPPHQGKDLANARDCDGGNAAIAAPGGRRDPTLTRSDGIHASSCCGATASLGCTASVKASVKTTGPATTGKGASALPTAGVQLVVQRFRRCRILLNDEEWVHVGEQEEEGQDGILATQGVETGEECDIQHHNEGHHNDNQPRYDRDRADLRQLRRRHSGLLVYVSFYRGASTKQVQEAAETVLNLPVLTDGAWGDGVSANESVLQRLDLEGHRETKKNDDAASSPTPARAPTAMTSIVLVPQANLICKAKKRGKSLQYHGQAAFGRGRDLYRLFVHEVRCRVVEQCCMESNLELPEWLNRREIESHRRDVVKGQKQIEEAEAEHIRRNQLLDSFLEGHSCRIVEGTFGTRQALALESDMGPFCHVVIV